MLLGLIARAGTFAVNAGLIFLLSQQAPQLDLLKVPSQPGLFENARNTVLTGLERVRADLEANGKLLFFDRRKTVAAPTSQERSALQLDQRELRTRHVTD